MSSIVDFIVFWKNLITGVFVDHTLAAALVTIVAIAVFLFLDKEVRKGKRPTNLMIVLVGWVILVPIVGMVMTVLAKIWAFFEKVIPMVTDVLSSFYKIYERHPLLVLILILLGFVTYFLWAKFRPGVLPNRTLRIAGVVVAVVVAAHIASPLANLVAPKGSPSQEKDAKAKQPESPATTSSAPVIPKVTSRVLSPSASDAPQPITPASVQRAPSVPQRSAPPATSQSSK
ncbi:MAG TPA: hypothetical protein VE034_06190 [Burkholderiales bacterium]|nr:hypothetical protein [Burkholderiales bacterium]